MKYEVYNNIRAGELVFDVVFVYNDAKQLDQLIVKSDNKNKSVVLDKLIGAFNRNTLNNMNNHISEIIMSSNNFVDAKERVDVYFERMLRSRSIEKQLEKITLDQIIIL